MTADLIAPDTDAKPVAFAEEARTRKTPDKSWLGACQADLDNVFFQLKGLFEKRCLQLGQTPSLVAKAMGVPRSYINGVFYRKDGSHNNMTFATMVRIFNHLGVDLAIFLKEKSSGSITSPDPTAQ